LEIAEAIKDINSSTELGEEAMDLASIARSALEESEESYGSSFLEVSRESSDIGGVLAVENEKREEIKPDDKDDGHDSAV